MKIPASIVVTLIILSLNTFGQSAGNDATYNQPETKLKKDSGKIIFQKYETGPSFKGGNEAWQKFLNKHIDYDVARFNNAPRGIYRVKVQFAIEPNGRLTDFKPLTRFGYGLEDEVLRALKKSPLWIPAVQSGKPVKSMYIQLVNFKVEVIYMPSD
ncbi:MAG: energy transducer TonB [Ferruginibacter sp.]